MVSIIIPVYNTPAELTKCLVSLQKQDYKDFEVIVVDDGSEQENKKTSWLRPKRGVNQENKGLDVRFYSIEHGGAPKARNYGFSKSKGDLILFCDADMELRDDCLTKMKKVLDESSEIDFVYCDFKYGWKSFKFWDFDVKKLKQNNYVNTCSMVRREKVVKWDESLKKFQDWDFWLSIVENRSKGKHIPEILFKANVKQGRMSYWLPKFVYKILIFKKLNRVKEYEKWKKVVQEKHGVSDL